MKVSCIPACLFRGLHQANDDVHLDGLLDKVGLCATAALGILLLCPVGSSWADDLHNVAWLAKVTTEPACEPGTERALTDGDRRRGLVFAVGTTGDAAVTFRFPRARTISRIRLFQPSDVYFSTTCEIMADVDGSGRFTKRLVGPTQLRPPGVWEAFAFEPTRVAAVRFRSLAGVSKGKRAHPLLGEFEAWGRQEPGEEQEWIQMGKAPKRFTQLKPLCLETALVAGGEPRSSILVPEGEGFAALGGRLADEIARRNKVRPAVTTDPAACGKLIEAVGRPCPRPPEAGGPAPRGATHP